MSLMIHRAKQREAKKNNAPIFDYENRNEEPLPFEDNNITFETKEEERKYTRTDINRMSIAELQNLATSVGIENADTKSGGELKKVLIEHFKL